MNLKISVERHGQLILGSKRQCKVYASMIISMSLVDSSGNMNTHNVISIHGYFCFCKLIDKTENNDEKTMICEASETAHNPTSVSCSKLRSE